MRKPQARKAQFIPIQVTVCIESTPINDLFLQQVTFNFTQKLQELAALGKNTQVRASSRERITRFIITSESTEEHRTAWVRMLFECLCSTLSIESSAMEFTESFDGETLLFTYRQQKPAPYDELFPIDHDDEGGACASAALDPNEEQRQTYIQQLIGFGVAPAEAEQIALEEMPIRSEQPKTILDTASALQKNTCTAIITTDAGGAQAYTVTVPYQLPDPNQIFSTFDPAVSDLRIDLAQAGQVRFVLEEDPRPAASSANFADDVEQLNQHLENHFRLNIVSAAEDAQPARKPKPKEELAQKTARLKKTITKQQLRIYELQQWNQVLATRVQDLEEALAKQKLEIDSRQPTAATTKDKPSEIELVQYARLFQTVGEVVNRTVDKALENATRSTP